MTPAQLINVIRFHLSDMGAQNAQHDFEHLCRHLTRAKIYANILPATGPVGAGGDGGRDFETYKSSIGTPSGPPEAVTQLSSGMKPVSFSCTLQQDGIQGKIKDDVSKIIDGGDAEEIIYFCEVNLPVAKRHDLKKWAQAEKNVELQIFDGNAIAELLSTRDVFWIAQEYLHIPAEYMPPATDEASWYTQLLDRWRSRSPLIMSNADFSEIKAGLRRATFHEDARPMLPLWLGLMEQFTSDKSSRGLQRAAIYEVAVASLRGKLEMSDHLGRIRDYMGDAEDWPSLADLQDAATLIVYSFGGKALGQFDADLDEMFSWRHLVWTLLDEQLPLANGHARRAGLYRIKGLLAGVPANLDVEPSPDESFECWNKMLDEAAQTTLFPIDDFADFITQITPMISADVRFRALADRVDTLVAKAGGPIASAESIFDRAIAFYRDDRLPEAVRDLHRAQYRWFHGDSLEKYQKATFLLANSYLELGLCYAAKNTALAASFLARHSESTDLSHTLPRMLLLAADADDAAGNSFSYLLMFGEAFGAHCLHEPDPMDFEKHPGIPINFGQIAALRGLAKRDGKKTLRSIDALLGMWPAALREPVVLASNDKAAFWQAGTWDEVWAGLEENFSARPLSDVGLSRTITWRAFDVTWHAICKNTYRIIPLAEEFVAALQIAMAALSGLDPSLIPTDIYIKLSVDEKADAPRLLSVKHRKTGHGVEVAVALAGGPNAAQPDGSTASVLAIVAGLLRTCSVLPDEALLELVKAGLLEAANRLHMGRPYRELYREFISEALFMENLRQKGTPLRAYRTFSGHQNRYLIAPRIEGPTYTRKESLEKVADRYALAGKSVRFTLKNLLKDPEKAKLLREWHDDGALDWEIVSIVANAAVNVRFPVGDDPAVDLELVEKYKAALGTPEMESDALNSEQISDELLRVSRPSWYHAVLNGWRLHESPAAQETRALERFLINRYGLRTDDVEHDDIFGWVNASAMTTSDETTVKPDTHHPD